MVKGSTIRAKHLSKDILSGLNMIAVRELTDYGDMVCEALAIATVRMVEEAEQLKDDAIINIRYAAGTVAQGAAEVLV